MGTPKCANCSHMTLERHEDYMGQQMWYYGECSEGCPLVYTDTADCSRFSEGEPKRKDCRVLGDW